MLHEQLQGPTPSNTSYGVDVLALAEIMRCGRWSRALASQRKDHRYYEIVEQTIRQDFDHRYFAIRDGNGAICAVVPCFVYDLDLLAGTRGLFRQSMLLVRWKWPRFMRSRTLMIGCAVGDGHLDDPDLVPHPKQVELLIAATIEYAKRSNANLIVFKEFPARYRPSLSALLRAQYTRVPSLPAASLEIGYRSFDDYILWALSSKTRKDLRRKFRTDGAIEFTVMRDITSVVEEAYPLYLQVYQRSQLRFEKLTKEYLCALGQRMPDRVRFFVWRRQGRLIAFSLCMVQGGDLFGDYLGFDYGIALDVHLYHRVFRDVITWAIANGYKRFHTSGGNYDPKLHLRFRLSPLDLYVRHTSPLVNFALSKLLPLLEPTHYDPLLKRFPNYKDLWS